MKGFVIQLTRQYTQEVAVQCKDMGEADAIASRLSAGADPAEIGVKLMPIDSQLSSSFNVKQIFDPEQELENADSSETL
jgi:methanogenic corrinoid protein MtbC1